MEQEIKDIISKNLPEQVGNVLKERLEKAERDAKELQSMNKSYADIMIELEGKKQKVKELEYLQNKVDSIRLSEQAIKEQKMELALQISEIKLSEAEKRAAELRGVLEVVFKSPVYRKQFINDIHYSYQNGASNPSFASKSSEINSEE